MRDLIQYPITNEEIIDVLMNLANEIDQLHAEDLVCGDIRPLVIQEAVRLIAGLRPTNEDGYRS